MKIAIDLNDVVRDYSNNFVVQYKKGYNHELNLEDVELYTNEMNLILPFQSERAYQKFLYQDFSYELFYKCPTCTENLQTDLNHWSDVVIKDIDSEEPIDVMFVSPMEYANSIQCTYMFLSKLGTCIREVYLPTDSLTIWDKCDVLITANPRLLENKPEDKISIKIDTDYNKNCPSDFSYKTLSSFLKKEGSLEELLDKIN